MRSSLSNFRSSSSSGGAGSGRSSATRLHWEQIGQRIVSPFRKGWGPRRLTILPRYSHSHSNPAPRTSGASFSARDLIERESTPGSRVWVLPERVSARRLCVIVAVAALSIAGCGGDERGGGLTQAQEQVPAAATQTVSSGERPPESDGVSAAKLADRKGDVAAADVDILHASVSRDELLRVSLELAGRPADDVIYGAFLSCGEELWQLGYKRAVGAATIFAFEFSGRQYEAAGSVTGSGVTISYPAAKMGCDRAFDVRFYAETTNARTSVADYAPEPGPDPLEPKALHVP